MVLLICLFCAQLLSRVLFFVTLCTISRQAPPGFSQQKYWSGLPFPPPRDLPDPGIEQKSFALKADCHLGSPISLFTFLLSKSPSLNSSPLRAVILSYLLKPVFTGAYETAGLIAGVQEILLFESMHNRRIDSIR